MPIGWGALLTGAIKAAPAVIGTIGAFREGRRAESRAEQDYASKEAQMAQINQLANRQLQLFDAEYAQRQEQRDYFRQQDDINRAILQNERDFDMKRMFRNDAQLAAERDYYINRQMDLDRDAAAERARQLQSLMQNQALAASEREVALEELRKAQYIASEESEQDRRNFHEAQFQMRAERQFAIEEMETKRSTARAERDFELQRRQELEGRLDSYSQSMTELQESFGPARRMAELSQRDIDARVSRREQAVTDNYDRVIDRMVGGNEADLMRRGIQGTDPGDTRDRIAARLADDLTMQQMAAGDAARAALGAEQNMLLSNIQGDYGVRQMAYNDLTAGQMAGFNEYAGLLNSSPSANNYNLDVGINSAAYDRGIQSANQYQTPIQIGSAIYDQAIGSGFGPTVNTPSAMNMQQLPSSSLMSPFGTTSFADASYLNAANSNLNNLLQGYMGSYENNENLATASGSAFNNNLTGLAETGVGFLEAAFPGTFGPYSNSAIAQRNPMGTTRGGYAGRP